jgi:hypothetical protein
MDVYGKVHTSLTSVLVPEQPVKNKKNNKDKNQPF